jgi:hypothetical protein
LIHLKNRIKRFGNYLIFVRGLLAKGGGSIASFRELKQVHIISETLSMETIRKLSTFIASKETYYISHDKYNKFLMKDLGMIFHSGSLVDTSRLDAFAYFKVMEDSTSNGPGFFCGFRVAVGCVANGNCYSTKGDLYNQIRN